ncbi:MAG: transglutaminase-like domain-containing protein [Bryobacteraceae bacterium]
MPVFCPSVIVPRIRIVRVPSGKPGTLHVAGIIGRMILAGARDFFVRQRAIQILREAGVPPKDRLGEAFALFRWVQSNVRYTRDILRVELLHTPRRMLELKAGDCDDMTILLGSMLRSTGHPVRIVLCGFRRDRPHSYSHIYPEVHAQGRWIALDATMSHPPGWAPPALWIRTCLVTEEGLQC